MRHSFVAMIVVFAVGITVTGNNAFSQQEAFKEQLLGAWELVSFNSVHTDGSKLTVFGDNPNGIAFFDRTGHYVITVMRSDRAKFAANDRAQGTADENKATALGTITYFGTYTVSEQDRTLNIHVVGSSFPNWNGTDQKRSFALKLTNPVASTGGTTEVVWKRAK
jgi:Lipocalin-like domain